MNDSSSTPPIRWWPAIVILGVGVAVAGIAQLWSSLDFQIRNVVVLVVIAVALPMLTTWWLLFSRAPWRMRLTVFALVLALGGALSAVYEWRNGQFRPHLRAALEVPRGADIASGRTWRHFR